MMYFSDVLDSLEGSFHNAGLPIRPRSLAESFFDGFLDPTSPAFTHFLDVCSLVSCQLGSFHKACHHVTSKAIALELLMASLSSFVCHLLNPSPLEMYYSALRVIS